VSDTKPILLAEAFPELSAELQQLLTDEGESSLAATVPSLPVVDRCRCGDDFCATFYVRPKPKGSYGPGHDTISLDPEKGMLILDVVDSAIVCVELLHRDEIRQKLLAMFP
jgi:hypothetical protein